MAISENENGNTICSICYDDLKPLTEFIQASFKCGHVFHGLCLQQWLEYGNANNTTCPVCKQTCRQEDVSRLYFQSIDDAMHSEMLPGKGREEDAQRLSRVKVMKLRGKVLGLTSSCQHQRRKLEDMNHEVIELRRMVLELTSSFEHQKRKLKDVSEELCKSKAMIEYLNRCNVEKEKDIVCYKALLNFRTEELVKAESECSALQQDYCLGYRKQLAAVKSASDISMDAKVKPASFGNADKRRYRVGIPKNFCCNFRQPQSPKAGSGGGGKARRFTKRTYLKAVEDKFQDSKGKYYEFIKVVKYVEANKIEISDARARVKDLLEGHQELVLGFNKLIAKNYKTQLQNNDRVFQLLNNYRIFKLFLDLERMHSRKSISKTELYDEAAIIFRRHPDLLKDIKQLVQGDIGPTGLWQQFILRVHNRSCPIPSKKLRVSRHYTSSKARFTVYTMLNYLEDTQKIKVVPKFKNAHFRQAYDSAISFGIFLDCVE